MKSAARLEKRGFEDPGLREFIQEQPGHSEWPPTNWDFASLTLVAFYYHPSLDVSRAQWATARAAEKTAAGRKNPVLTLVPGMSVNPPQGLSPWIPLGSVDLPIETAGKRKKRQEQAGYLSESTRLNIQTAAWQVRSNLRSALLEWRFQQQRLELLDRQLALQGQIVQLLEQRLAAGAASPFEVTTARAARLRIEADAADARQRFAAAQVLLADSLGVTTLALSSIEIAASEPAMALNSEKLMSSQARELALQARSDIRAALAEYAASEAALRLEIARQYPDLHFNPGYQFDEGEHKWTLGLSLELPMLNRNEGPIAEAEARRREVAARFEALQAKVITEIDSAAKSFRALSEQSKRNQTLLELQRRQEAALQTALTAGGADRL
ncbi:MAG TPA: TolC family protein, partial [Verrucomicrobiae bacterium]|nr:TolC family protein [Verrucomicrobiae bacterium]